MNAYLAPRAHPRSTVFTLQRQVFPLAALAAAMACLGVATDARAQARPSIAAHVPGAPQFVAGRILVQPRAGLSDKELDKVLEPHGGKRAKHIKPINVHVVELPEKANVEAIARALGKHKHVKFAELDLAAEHAVSTNDPSIGSEWHIPKIQANTAWDTSSGAGVTIAVLDTGVEATHPDLAAAIVPGWNVYDNNSDTSDVHGHGTWVAGTAAAVGNNAQGVAGVAWQSKIMPIRIADPSAYAYWSTMASGITWAADHGAKVANLSYQNSCGSATVQNAAQYMRNKGGVVVISAGNTGVQIADAASTSVTCVSATDSADNKASWSSYGPAVDVAAPGVGILTTTRGGGYANANGTSFSAPIVSATYALMMAANKNLSPAGLDSALYSTARDLGSAGVDSFYGNGRIDAAAAVAKATQTVVTDTTPPSVAISNPTTGTKVSGLTTVDVSASDASGIAKVELYVNNSLLATDLVGPYGFSWDTSNLQDGPATLVAKAFDNAGNPASSSSVSVTVGNDTVPPTVSIGNPANGSLVSGSVGISVSAADNVKVAKITLTIDGKQVAQSYGNTLSYNWDTGSGGRGKKRTTSGTKSTISAKAEDAAANVASASVSVTKQ
jgi:subtilisin family serine protease